MVAKMKLTLTNAPFRHNSACIMIKKRLRFKRVITVGNVIKTLPKSVEFGNVWMVMSTSPTSKNTNGCRPPLTCFAIFLFLPASSRIHRIWSLNDFFLFTFVGLLFVLFISLFILLAILQDFPWLGVLIRLLEVLTCCVMSHTICILFWFGICITSAIFSRTNFLIRILITLLESNKKSQVKLIILLTFNVLFKVNTSKAKYLLTHFKEIWICNYSC